MIVLDPGQGGHSTTDSYGSTGIPEGQVNLALAWRVAEHLGQEVALTRTGDVGIGLAERARLASDVGADTFVSLHSDPDRGYGARAWVHPDADPGSRALGNALGETFGSGLEERDFSVLEPSRLPSGTRACLVEVGCPPHTDLASIDALAAQIAGAIRATPAWGGPTEGLSAIPYNPTSMGSSIAAFRRWQQDLTRFLVGVPRAAHAFWPHSAICKIYATDAQGRGPRPPGGGGTGFLISPTRVLTAGHVLRGRVRCIVAPGEAENTPVNTRIATGAANIVTHPQYRRGDESHDIGVIKLPEPIRDVRPIQLGIIRQSVQEGVAVCGYASRVRQSDMRRWRTSVRVNPNVQHISKGAATADSALEVLRYTCQTLRGSSGSPVLYYTGGALKAVGVHSGSHNAQFNDGARLTQQKIQWIRSI